MSVSFVNDAKELRELIAQYPNLPIVMLADAEVVCEESGYWFCPKVIAYKGEIYDDDAPFPKGEERVYIERGEFEDDLEDYLWDHLWDELGRQPKQEEVEKALEDELKYLEIHWKDVIIVKGTL